MRQCSQMLRAANVPRMAAARVATVATLGSRSSSIFAVVAPTPSQLRLLHSSRCVSSATSAKSDADGSPGAAKSGPDSEPSAATGSASEASAGGSTSSAPRKKPGRLSSLMDSAKDVFAVVFGTERKRDLGAEYDAGLRKYPWYSYADPTDPESGRVLYRNEETGVVTEHKPADFDMRAPPDARMVPLNMEATAISVVAPQLSAYQRMISALGDAPLIRVLAEAGQAVAASPVGEAAAKVRDKVRDKVEDAREVWETSQHPLVVNASYAVDSLMAESESGRALREIQLLDESFDSHAFLEEMQVRGQEWEWLAGERDARSHRRHREHSQIELPVMIEMACVADFEPMKLKRCRGCIGAGCNGLTLHLLKLVHYSTPAMAYCVCIAPTAGFVLISEAVHYSHLLRTADRSAKECTNSALAAVAAASAQAIIRHFGGVNARNAHFWDGIRLYHMSCHFT